MQEGTVVTDRVGETPCVFLAGLHRAERTIAERLMRLATGKPPWPWIDPDKALPWVEGRIGLALAESQVAAIRLALMSKVLVMTGGPGVGKTTIVYAILRILAAKGTRSLRGWSNYFGYGSRAKAYRSVDQYVFERVRRFLARRHKVQGRGNRRFTFDVIHRELGVLCLQRLPRAVPSCALR